MKTTPVTEVEERLAAIEQKLEELSLALRGFEKRMASLPDAASEPESSVAEEPVLATLSAELSQQGAVLNALTLVGRSCLVLGGAFLIRSLTDSGTLPLAAGAGLGLAYAIVWILLAGRAAGRGHSASGAFLGITAVVIAYPLIAETTTRFKVFAPSGAAAILVALTALCLGVAWRGNLPLLAWAALFGAAGVSFTLSLVTGAVESFAAALLLIGVAAAWVAYGRRQWHGPRWVAAAAADLLMLWAALRLAPGSQPGAGPELSSSAFLLLAFALPFLYMGTFALRTLARRQDVEVFDVVQTIAALAIGLGGAALVVRHVQDAQPTLGASAVGIAAGCYGIAFVFVARRQSQRRNFLFYSTLALLLTLCGSALMAGGAALGILWSVLALAAAALAARFGRLTLAFHSAVYCLAAAWQAGLFAASSDAFLATPAAPWAPFSGPALGALAASLCCLLLLSRVKEETRKAGWRLPRLALSVIVAYGAGGIAVAGLRGLAGADAAALAALRTAVLASAALPLAALRRADRPELGWLSYAVLILAAGKLLMEDLPGGRPATLFVAFAFYGAALLATPRLLRRAPLPPREAGPSPNP